MNYGYFDDAKREYVITRPDTPAPWANYLGSPEYGALISNNAGGYSFAKSGANGRLLRYVFNQFDQPGRYIYLRDNENGDYWSASWQPVAKPLAEYKSECRHGTGYTKMLAEYAGIRTEVRYYVPLGAEHEVWNVRVENISGRPRSISVTGYAEFTNNSNYEQDQVNLQYSQFVVQTAFMGDRVRQMIHANLCGVAGKSGVDGNDVTERFFGLAGAPVASWCGDKAGFLGAYRGYGNPEGVESGALCCRDCYNGNSCGALCTVLNLAAGASAELAFVAGMKPDAEAAEIMRRYSGQELAGPYEIDGHPVFTTLGRVKNNPEYVCARELGELAAHWHGLLDHFKVRTPSKELDTMINTWNAYNCFMTFIWSRAASFTYCGLRNGYGYRDTVQDIQGVIHLAPDMAAEKIRFMLSAQAANGGGLPLVKFTHNAGHEDTPDDASYVKETGHPAYRADDALWLFPTIYKYIAETGDTAFLDEVIPFANHGEGTVYEHLKRAVKFSQEHLGPHGLPAGLYADWNDCLRLGKNGESSFVALQYYYAMAILRDFAQLKNDTVYAAGLAAHQKRVGELIQSLCWDKDRFIRGIAETGEVIGGRDAPEANLWLNPQSWAVISGLAGAAQADAALEQVHERLNTPYGAILMDPPYREHAFDGAIAVIYNAGTKENAGIFSQTQGWLILAEALRGHGGRAFEYYIENNPAAQNSRAEVRRLEPYCYGQFTEGKASPFMGRSHVHWLTGTASTMMVGCVEGILGMRPDIGGLHIAPSIPAEWAGFEVEKDFRGCHLHIVVKNPGHAESGCKKMLVNGKPAAGDYVPAALLTAQTEIELIMS